MLYSYEIYNIKKIINNGYIDNEENLCFKDKSLMYRLFFDILDGCGDFYIMEFDNIIEEAICIDESLKSSLNRLNIPQLSLYFKFLKKTLPNRIYKISQYDILLLRSKILRYRYALSNKDIENYIDSHRILIWNDKDGFIINENKIMNKTNKSIDITALKILDTV